MGLFEAKHLSLTQGIASLRQVAELGEARMPDADMAAARAVLQLCEQRNAAGLETTVVALAGGTGAGKSSLFNAVAGTGLAKVSAIRPTTAQALSVSAVENPQVLDWLGVSQRHVDPGLASRFALSGVGARGLVLLDLPDIDSTRESNRVIAAKFISQVDVLLWVVDPQKYADAILYEEYLVDLSEHAATTLVVMNQIDLLNDSEAAQVMRDATQRLHSRGINAAVIPASAKTGAGIEEIRHNIARIAADRGAASEKLAADLRQLAKRLYESLGTGTAKSSGSALETEEQRLVAAVVEVLGGREIARLAADSHRYRGGRATSWPLLRWWRARRADPLVKLRSLGILGTAVAHAAKSEKNDAGEQGFHEGGEEEIPLSVPSLVTDSFAASRFEQAIGRYLQVGGARLPLSWRQHLATLGAVQQQEILAAAGQLISRLPLQRKHKPIWWTFVNLLQWILVLTGLAGAAWLLLLNFGHYLGIFLPQPPVYGICSLPLILLVAAIAVGWLLSGLCRALINVGARRVSRRVTSALEAQVRTVVDTKISQPLAAELAAYDRYAELLSAIETTRG